MEKAQLSYTVFLLRIEILTIVVISKTFPEVNPCALFLAILQKIRHHKSMINKTKAGKYYVS